MIKKFLVASCTPWHERYYTLYTSQLPGEWELVKTPEEFSNYLKSNKPDLIFFLHWSWILEKEIIQEFECICFHMTDLPYGRGGSPLQNLILLGHSKTVVSSFKMTECIDDGPIYLKSPLSLEGTAEEIYKNATLICWLQIQRIVEEKPQPKKQTGEIVAFKRRSPHDSVIPERINIEECYNFIRMLDAPTYPKAFLKNGSLIFQFSEAKLVGDKVNARVVITRENEN